MGDLINPAELIECAERAELVDEGVGWDGFYIAVGGSCRRIRGSLARGIPIPARSRRGMAPPPPPPLDYDWSARA